MDYRCYAFIDSKFLAQLMGDASYSKLKKLKLEMSRWYKNNINYQSIAAFYKVIKECVKLEADAELEMDVNDFVIQKFDEQNILNARMNYSKIYSQLIGRVSHWETLVIMDRLNLCIHHYQN